MTAREIRVRPYTEADGDEPLELFRRSVRKLARGDYSDAQIAAWAGALDREAFAAKLARSATYIATDGGRIAGFADFDGDGHIDMLYVDPAHVRRGIARALLGHIEREARTRGIARLHAEASLTARPAFERCGFRVVGSQAVARGGERFVNFRVEKLLAG